MPQLRQAPAPSLPDPDQESREAFGRLLRHVDGLEAHAQLVDLLLERYHPERAWRVAESVLLVGIDGRSVEEAARLLGCSESSVWRDLKAAERVKTASDSPEL